MRRDAFILNNDHALTDEMRAFTFDANHLLISRLGRVGLKKENGLQLAILCGGLWLAFVADNRERDGHSSTSFRALRISSQTVQVPPNDILHQFQPGMRRFHGIELVGETGAIVADFKHGSAPFGSKGDFCFSCAMFFVHNRCVREKSLWDTKNSNNRETILRRMIFLLHVRLLLAFCITAQKKRKNLFRQKAIADRDRQ